MSALLVARNATHSHGHSGRPDPSRIAQIVNEEVSVLAPYSGIILVVILIIFFLIRHYLLEKFLLVKWYGDKYRNLSENQRRGFVNHHIAAAAKIVMLVFASYPIFSVMSAHVTVRHGWFGSHLVTLGDVLLVFNQVFVAMYVFELLYRAELSYVAVAHHTGSVLIAQSAVTISMQWEHREDALFEFLICYAWGIFDVICEFWPHVAIILYRKYPTDHGFLRKVFLFATCVTFLGTVVETAVVFYLWGSLWNKWTTPFKVVTPILHCIFSAAQLWGAWNFLKMFIKQNTLFLEEDPLGKTSRMRFTKFTEWANKRLNNGDHIIIGSESHKTKSEV